MVLQDGSQQIVAEPGIGKGTAQRALAGLPKTG